MISSTHGFLFVHIPKTGGNSLIEALLPYADDAKAPPDALRDGIDRFELVHPSLPTSKHSTLQEYRKLIGEVDLEKLFKFACVRNPFDRAVSQYFSPIHARTHFDPKEFKRLVKQDATMLDRISLSGQDRHVMDFVLRFEQLESDFGELLRKLGLEHANIGLPHRNRSSHDDYRCYYDRRLRRLVEKIYSRDLAAFGYTF